MKTQDSKRNLNCLATEAPELKEKDSSLSMNGFLLRWECPRGGRSPDLPGSGVFFLMVP